MSNFTYLSAISIEAPVLIAPLLPALVLKAMQCDNSTRKLFLVPSVFVIAAQVLVAPVLAAPMLVAPVLAAPLLVAPGLEAMFYNWYC